MISLGLRGRLSVSLGSPGQPVKVLPPPFSPAATLDLAFSHDAAQSEQIMAGGAVERWGDLSGNGNDALQSLATARPTAAVDAAGRPALRFDGADDALVVLTLPDLGPGSPCSSSSRCARAPSVDEQTKLLGWESLKWGI